MHEVMGKMIYQAGVDYEYVVSKLPSRCVLTSSEFVPERAQCEYIGLFYKPASFRFNCKTFYTFILWFMLALTRDQGGDGGARTYAHTFCGDYVLWPQPDPCPHGRLAYF